jgi:hypothetical protein
MVATRKYARLHERARNIGKMKLNHYAPKSGKIGWILLWLLGVPIPVLLIFFLLRGCT